MDLDDLLPPELGVVIDSLGRRTRWPISSIEERFWAKVDKDGPVPEHRPDLGPCWLWTAATDGRGYGAFYDGTRTSAGHRRVVKAHRWAFVAENGPIPVGLEPDHLCRVTLCVRLSHLEAVTHRENSARGMSPSAVAHREGVCQRGHLLMGVNVIRKRDGSGECRTCNNERRRGTR